MRLWKRQNYEDNKKKISGCQGWKKWITEDFYTNYCVCNCNGGYTPLYTCLHPTYLTSMQSTS